MKLNLTNHFKAVNIIKILFQISNSYSKFIKSIIFFLFLEIISKYFKKKLSKQRLNSFCEIISFNSQNFSINNQEKQFTFKYSSELTK